MVNESPGSQQVTHAEPPAVLETLASHRLDFSMLSPSARTSFTRVDTMINGEDDEGVSQDERNDDVEPTALGEGAQQDAQSEVPQTPQVSLTFLLVSGKRRSMTFEPEITVGRTKELVWNAWPKGTCMNDYHCQVACRCSQELPSREPVCDHLLNPALIVLIISRSKRLARRATACAVVSADTVPRQNTARRRYPHKCVVCAS